MFLWLSHDKFKCLQCTKKQHVSTLFGGECVQVSKVRLSLSPFSESYFLCPSVNAFSLVTIMSLLDHHTLYQSHLDICSICSLSPFRKCCLTKQSCTFGLQERYLNLFPPKKTTKMSQGDWPCKCYASKLVNLVQGVLPHGINTFPGVHKSSFLQMLVDTTPGFNYNTTSLIMLKINVRRQVTRKRLQHRWQNQVMSSTHSLPQAVDKSSHTWLAFDFLVFVATLCQIVLMLLEVKVVIFS